jgi:hypothetical protein
MSTTLLKHVASSVADTAKNAAQEHALKQIKKLELEKKLKSAAGKTASGYTADIVNEDDVGRIADLAKNPNQEGLINVVKSNATVGKALDNPLLRKAAAANEMAQKTLNDPSVTSAVSHASSVVNSTTAAKTFANPNTGGKYKRKTRKNKRKTRKYKRKTRKNKRKI